MAREAELLANHARPNFACVDGWRFMRLDSEPVGAPLMSAKGQLLSLAEGRGLVP
jgi:hypothetical protein